MRSIFRSQKDFWLGVVYSAVGASAFLIARDYPFGSSASIDAGFLPSIVSALLFIVGVLSILRSLKRDGHSVGALNYQALVLIIGSTVLFGILVDRAGFTAAAVILLLTSAAASREFRLRWWTVSGALVLAAVCTIVFITGLGIPMPVFGPWLGG